MRAPRAYSCRSEIVGISGKEMDMKVIAPQFGIGKIHLPVEPKPHNCATHPVKPHASKYHAPSSPKPASVADLVMRGWSHTVISTTKTHAVVEFHDPLTATRRETRTILRGMLPEASRHPVLHPGKTRRDHESGVWKQHLDNQAAHAALNRGHALDYHAIGGKDDHKKGKDKK